MLMSPLAEACLGIVFLAQDEFGRGGNGSSVERGPRAGKEFPRVHPSSVGRLGRGRVLSDCRVEPRASRGSHFLDLGECV